MFLLPDAKGPVMNINFFLRWLLLGALFLVPLTEALAMDRYDLLIQARGHESERRISEAIATYANYIDTHPAVVGNKTGPYKKNAQYYLKNLLIAFSGMLDLQQQAGDLAAVKEGLERLRGIEGNNLFGSKNLYSLGKIYRDHDALPDAITCLRKVVDAQEKSPLKTNNKVFIRSCYDLAEIYHSQGQDRDVESILGAVEKSLAEADYDFKDRYRIGSLLLDHGKNDKGAEIMAGILKDAEIEGVAEEKAVVRTLVKLLELSGGDSSKRTSIIAVLTRMEEGGVFDPGSLYVLGIACLNADETAQGVILLDKVRMQAPETNYARRALFVLGRRAASDGSWDEAIRHYADYVNRYPEPRFFALKAYSRLIDCQWAKLKDPAVMAEQSRHLADIVNDIADFEAQLNLARDLNDKGFPELAEATFELGMLDVRNRLQRTTDAEERLRILCAVEKYAYPLGKFQLVEDSAKEALAIIGDSGPGGSKSSEKIGYFKEQTYIWLAQTYRDTQRVDEAISTLERFLAEFEGSRDADFVRYTLAEIHETKGNGHKSRALYEKIGGGVWRDRAEKKLKKEGEAL